MGLTDLLPLFAQGGALGVFASVLYLFYRGARKADERAVAAHEKRADDAWAAYEAAMAAYEAAMKRSDVRDAQVAHILAAVPRSTAAIAPPVKEGT